MVVARSARADRTRELHAEIRMTPNTPLATLLTDARARLQRPAFARGASAGLIFGIVIAILAWWRGWNPWPVALAGVGIAAAAGLFAARRTASRDADVAAIIEQKEPHNNLLVTAAELLPNASSN